MIEQKINDLKENLTNRLINLLNKETSTRVTSYSFDTNMKDIMCDLQLDQLAHENKSTDNYTAKLMDVIIKSCINKLSSYYVTSQMQQNLIKGNTPEGLSKKKEILSRILQLVNNANNMYDLMKEDNKSLLVKANNILVEISHTDNEQEEIKQIRIIRETDLLTSVELSLELQINANTTTISLREVKL